MHRKAEGKAVVDYSFHVILSDLNESTLREMPVMIDRGYTSFKMFTTYEALRVTDDVLLKALIQAGPMAVWFMSMRKIIRDCPSGSSFLLWMS
ncbi:MAG: hypothetical protein M1609_06405 [Firmicutes bacterium]|nr:hypothetical protein [Bacillota bacterium]MCL5780425.1 hypothetical protein [Bacillota bacterium]